ncbi:hypothetical protein [Paraburkholderia hospita]|jgi:hypothetical protein|uniref:hypothetical protein n=1 Tax=Paraburkholderia TaxID=1822464 RepID=UPI000271AE04|nr:hypothetical protein [Paraburkholderia hospita]EUC16970.1 hypothetical protein PMI06_000466 [Burkholderia sp. BT03]OUL89674.1 hypothetical protein CA603_18280 [Paraburkholderia hospita]SKD01294.1 hypothetical protein SAMN05445504_8343 [Burkholderia sp. CF099]SKD03603.1 hypothetical protein SAMN06266956_8270 [Paraburkholderia hospita]
MIDRNHTVYVLAAVAPGVAPLSGNADETIHVKLTDKMIQFDPGIANAGRVTFEVNTLRAAARHACPAFAADR